MSMTNRIYGTTENDELVGTSGSDFIAGYDGSDILDGGAGSDWLNGGNGHDIYRWDPVTGGRDRIDDQDGNYTIQIDALASELTFSSLNMDGRSLRIQFGHTAHLDVAQFFYSNGPLQAIVFADGTTWNREQVLAALTGPLIPSENIGPEILRLDGGRVTEGYPGFDPAVGWVRAHDENGDALTYTLLDDAGGRFRLDGHTVRVADWSLIDYETARFHNIRVLVTDSSGATAEETFTLEILDRVIEPPPPPQNQAPNDLFVWAADVPENAQGGYAVGQIFGSDPDGDQLTYRIINQDSPFVLKGNQIFLREGAVLDYETRPVQIVTIEASDGRGGTLTRTFDIKIKDMPESPPPNIIYGTEGRDDIFVDQGDVQVYSLGGGDTILTFNGNNSLNGGAGDDYIVAYDGNSSLNGDAGDDYLEAGNENDTLDGGSDSDVLCGGDGDDTYIWGAESGTTDQILDIGGVDILKINGTADEFSFKRSFHSSLLITKGPESTGAHLNIQAYFDGDTKNPSIDHIVFSDGTVWHYEDILKAVENPPQNHAPEVLLIGGYVPENVPSGTYVGNIYVADPDNDPVQLELVDNAGGRFTLDGHRLLVLNGSKLDYETAMAHDIWVRATDSHGGMTLKRFTITVTDVNEDQNPPPDNQDPTMLMLDGVQVLENSPTGAVVGYLHGADPDGDPLSFSLLDDAGGRFKIEHNRVVVADGTKLDYETAQTHPIRVQVSDGRGGFREATFTIHVRDRPDTPPSNQSPEIEDLLGSIVLENAATGTIVGTVAAHDPDGDPLTYELLDNSDGRFKIENNTIVVADGSRLDYEASSSHTVRVRVSDGRGLSDTKVFTIIVKDVNENPPPPDNHAPTDIVLSDDAVAENSDNGTVVGLLIGKDQDAGDNLTYTLLDDAGGRFGIVGDELVVKNGAKLDYETQASHVVQVRVTDSHNLSFVKSFVIQVEDEEDESTDGSDGNDTIVGGAGEDVFSGGLGNDLLTGGAGNDSLSGDAGADRLFGGQGKDVISGGLGADTLTGGAGKDVFVFDTKPGAGNIDRITDFSVKDDTIHLAKAIFKAAGPKGSLSKGAFWIGSEAHTTSDRIVYDADNGKLFYDADGTGSKEAVQIALLKKGLALTAKDFLII